MRIKRTAAILLAMVLVFCGMAWAEAEVFRNGKVIEVTGSASVARNNYQMPVYAQMVIQSGDRLATEADGQVVLCLDEDKYLILEPETKALFEMEGTPQKGMIRIHLLEGAIYSEIENPLLDGDAYEIHTTDGVMAVRGTNFRASHELNEEDQQRRTDIQLFFGELDVSTSGEPSQEETLSAGEEISITTPLDESGNPVGELGAKKPLDMDGLPDGYDRDKLSEREGLFRQNGEGSQAGDGAAICPACQQEILREEEHEPVGSRSKYCRERHYRCTGYMHYCDPQADYNGDKAGLQGGCGDRYGCESSNAHTICRMCGDMWCDYSRGGHETPCGNADHRPCQINQSGHYRKSDHQECPYGCGGWLCEGSHERLNCEHCQQVSGTHQVCAYCEEWQCYPGDVPHGTDEGQCGYVPPVACAFCAAEDVQHDAAPCGKHCTAQSGTHEKCDGTGGCGGWLCEGSHERLSCGHCQQVNGTHQVCAYCEEWLCYPGELPHGTSEGQCGYFEPIPCFGCGEVGGNHNTQFCNTHCEMQAGDHSYCEHCGNYKCSTGADVEHGEGLCNLP